jgi:hypothetical protein
VIALLAADSLEQGEYEEAVTLGLALVRYVDNFEEVSTRSSTVEYLVALAVRGIGYDTLENVSRTIRMRMQEGTLSQAKGRDNLNLIHDSLSVTAPDAGALVATAKSEYAMQKYIILNMLIEIRTAYMWHPKRTVQNQADFFCRISQFLRPVRDSAEEEAAFSQLDGFVAASRVTFPWVIFERNSVGKILQSVVFKSINTPNSPRLCRGVSASESLKT